MTTHATGEGEAVTRVPDLESELPTLFVRQNDRGDSVWEFLTARIRNPHTRRAYARAITEFAAWCTACGIDSLESVTALQVATYLEQLQQRLRPPSVKQRLAALRALFDWLVVRQQLPVNPAAAVRGPRYSVRIGQTPVLSATEAHQLLAGIDRGTPIGRRDHALLSLMLYTFARVSAVVQLRRGDLFLQAGQTWIRLHEKGGKEHPVPMHPQLQASLQPYLAQDRPANPQAVLFPSAPGRKGALSNRALEQSAVWRMLRRRLAATGIATAGCCHSLRATGITEYLRHGGTLEVAQHLANHASPRTTSLYDRRSDLITLQEIGKIQI